MREAMKEKKQEEGNNATEGHRAGLYGGAAALAAGLGMTVLSMVYKVKEAISHPASFSIAKEGVSMSGWSLNIDGVTLKDLSYNSVTNQWNVEILNNSHVLKDITANAYVTYSSGSTPDGIFSFIIKPVQGTSSANVFFSGNIPAHTIAAYPWWHTDVLIGGIALATVGVATIVVNIVRNRKYKKMLRTESAMDNDSADVQHY